MPPLESIIAVTIAGFILSATPGPSMLYVLSRSVGQSRAAGLASALGLGLGGVFLAVATAMGLAAVLTNFDWLILGLKYIGSGYLVWLGLTMIRDARKDARFKLKADKVDRTSFSTIVWQGVLVEFLNPKTVLFFALFLPPFVSSATGGTADGNVQIQLLILGAIVPLTAVPSDILVAFLGGSMAEKLNRQQSLREVLAWIGGLILIAIALNLHLEFI